MAEGQTNGDPPDKRPGELSVAVTAADGIHVVTVAGEIDHQSGVPLREALEDIARIPHPRTVADLHQVAFMDSSGINILIGAHRALTKNGGWLRLAAPTPAVARTLQIVGLDTVIDCHDTLHHALHA